jgi:hypothetical protein
MAVKTSLKTIARRIGDAIRSFGSSEGLIFSDFTIAGTFDEQTERIYLVVGCYRPIDERRWHSGIMNAIRKELSETSRVVLVVLNISRIEEIYQEMVLGGDEIDITEMF